MAKRAVKTGSLARRNMALDDQDAPNDPITEKAADWMMALTSTQDVVSVLPQLNAWLREKPAHRRAFAEMQCVWRLTTPLLLAGEPGAGLAESDAFWEALEEETARSPGLFAEV